MLKIDYNNWFYNKSTIHLQNYYLCLSSQCLGHKPDPCRCPNARSINDQRNLLSWIHDHVFTEDTILTGCFLVVSEHSGNANTGQCTQGPGPLSLGTVVLGFFTVLDKLPQTLFWSKSSCFFLVTSLSIMSVESVSFWVFPLLFLPATILSLNNVYAPLIQSWCPFFRGYRLCTPMSFS